MKKYVPKFLKALLLRLFGLEQRARPLVGIITDMEEIDRQIIDRVTPYTMTGDLRVESLLKAVRHVVETKTPGAFVECGVWKGGSVLAMILMLQELGVNDRDVYLYDTFEGMTEPGAEDVSAYNESALSAWRKTQGDERLYDHYFNAEVFNLDLVRSLLLKTGYPESRLHFIRGKVEETIPGIVPDMIAILRLDTDWYESTRHEFVHLYPRLESGGILIIDDYGHWQGAKQAADEYLARPDVAPILLHRIDYSGRIGQKP